jgi:hypothetical protein
MWKQYMKDGIPYYYNKALASCLLNELLCDCCWDTAASVVAL